MKIGQILVILIVLVAIIAGVVVYTNSNNEVANVQDENVQEDVSQEEQVNEEETLNKEALNIASAADLTAFVDKVYEGLELFPSLASMELDLTDVDTLTYETGLSSADKIDSVVVSTPMMSSQAYSMILVKVKDGEDADSIAKEMSENVNPNKWICVSAEKTIATSSGNVAFLVMTNAEMADSVYGNFKKLAGESGPEYSKDNVVEDVPMEEDMMIPAV